MNHQKNSNIEEEICYLDEIIIEGITTEGKKFRPSDWVERLCGMLAAFNDNQKVSYSPYLRPLMYKNMNCVAVKKSLQQKNSNAYDFIMQFATDNKLVVVECSKFKNDYNENK